ncbi:hypothetical protein EUGRSUZ_A02784 [Eucalyptus grandis]|uniref:Uncharacterized protein n=2 Tax=Eucalyptus grandis TaxID=71139 RepID=A0ACC3M8H7_EUCGR|nr:hypothetical protein EUGRSUZ_A02784 [Eucalyptus grandis]
MLDLFRREGETESPRKPEENSRRAPLARGSRSRPIGPAFGQRPHARPTRASSPQRKALLPQTACRMTRSVP